jgi:hypothetical protein
MEEQIKKQKKWYLSLPFILMFIVLVSATGTYFFLTHVTGVVHSGLIFSNTGNQNIGTCWTGSTCNSNNLSVQVNGNQNFLITATIPNGVDEIVLNGLNVINQYNDSSKWSFNVSQSSGNYNFYIGYKVNKYATDNLAILSDIQGA